MSRNGIGGEGTGGTRIGSGREFIVLRVRIGGEDIRREDRLLLGVEEEGVGRVESLTLNFSNLFTTSSAMNEEEGESDGEESDDGGYDCHFVSVTVLDKDNDDLLAPAIAAVAFEVAACSLTVGGPS